MTKKLLVTVAYTFDEEAQQTEDFQKLLTTPQETFTSVVEEYLGALEIGDTDLYPDAQEVVSARWGNT